MNDIEVIEDGVAGGLGDGRLPSQPRSAVLQRFVPTSVKGPGVKGLEQVCLERLAAGFGRCSEQVEVAIGDIADENRRHVTTLLEVLARQ